jgi:type II secretory pathway component PulF
MPNAANIYMPIIGGVAALAGVVGVQLLVPQFEELFINFGAELPALTRVFVNGRSFLWPLPLLVPLAAFLIKTRDTTDNRPGIVALLLGIAIAFGLPLVCALAMYLPIFELAEAAH